MKIGRQRFEDGIRSVPEIDGAIDLADELLGDR